MQEATNSTPAKVRDIYTLAYAACASLANGLMDQPAISHLARCLAITVEDSCFDLDRRDENYDDISLNTSVEALRYMVNGCILRMVQGQYERYES